MAISWGAWEYSGGNGMRVGIEVDWEAVSHTEGAATATVRYYTENQYSYSDSQSLNLGGAIDGSISFTNNSGSSPVQRGSRTYTYNYGSGEYGSSPGSRTFSATLQGAFNGVTPSKSVTSQIPARPIGAPTAPSSVTVSRVSDTTHKVTWNNNSTNADPWDRVRIQYDIAANDAWNGDVGTAGGSSTSFTDNSTYANNAFKFRVRSENDAGNSGWVETAVVYTTPAAPSSPTRSGTTTQSLSWVNNVNGTYVDYVTEVLRSLNGGAWTVIATVAEGVTTYTDTVLASDKVKYKFRARTNGGAQGTLYSADSPETSETIGATSPPNAPTMLSPANNALINPTQSRTFTWQHNPTDGSTQTQFQFQWRVQGSPSWTLYAATTTSAQAWSFPANTFPDNSTIEWQIRTRGANATFSPFSATATFKTVGDPNAGRANKRPLWQDLETGETVTAPTGSLAPIGSMMEFAGAAAPPGWLLCQGQLVNRADYPDLFGVIGTAFNTGGETTTQFRLPDRRDRVGVGASATKALGSTGGADTVTLATTNLPPHQHGMNHGHTMQMADGTGSRGNQAARSTLTNEAAGNAVNSFSGNTGTGSDTGLNSTPVNIQNRYQAFNYIIKV